MARTHMVSALMVGALAASVAACTPAAPVPPSVPTTMELIERPVVTRPPDSHDVSLPALVGTSTTTTIAFAAGKVNISGRVTGPDGPVAGATVRVERLVGGQSAVATVQSDASGVWRLSNVTGGVIRVQAYRVPDLALPQSAVTFASGDTELDLELEKYGGTNLQWAMAPSRPVAGRTLNLVVQVAVKRVDPDGYVRVAPLGGIGVTLIALGSLQPLSTEARITDENGRVSFKVACAVPGSSALRIELATGEESTISPAECVPAPTLPPPTPAPTLVPPPVESVPATVVPQPTLAPEQLPLIPTSIG